MLLDLEPSLLGTFVKSIMRIVMSYVGMVREVALGLGQFEVHNALDNHIDRLLGGLVTNASLYLNFDLRGCTGADWGVGLFMKFYHSNRQ